MLSGLALALGGLVVLTVAADEFVAGAARLAVTFRIAPVVVGAVVVGFGTSAPEMVVSALAAQQGNVDLGVGNVIGSNVANISLVLGVVTWVTAVPVRSSTIRREAPMSVGAVAIFAVLVQGGVDRWEGGALAALLVVSLGLVLSAARPDDHLAEEVEELVATGASTTPVEVARTLVGLVVVVASSAVLVEGAERVADALDISGGFVGFTLVALGTSAPELVTSLAAARRGETDLLVGNLLGSNLFNALAVGGIIGLVGPGPVLDTTLEHAGSLLMVGICALSWSMMTLGGTVTRRNGMVLTALWVVSVLVLSRGEETLALALGR
ncbi:MAG: calcium/sodium antiporter [Acidimicrobiales bacterium]